MKIRRGCIGIVILLMAVLLFIVQKWHAVFKTVVRIPLLGWLVEYNISPSDFYTPLDEVPLQVGSLKLEFICKYRGRHEIQIRGIDSMLLWESNVGMNIVIRNDNGRILYKKATANSQVLGGTNAMYNYCYGIFNVPDDVPLETKIIAEITCYGEVTELLRHFPNAKIVAIKAFDK